MNAPARRPRFFYGYNIIASAFVIQILTWGLYNSYGVFFSPLLDEFGWSRATIAGAASVSQFLVGVGAAFMGRLNDRFGPRLLMTYTGVMVGIGFFLMYWTSSVWQLYLFQGFIVGIGISGVDVVLLSTTARWFSRRRGMMSGIVKVGTGVGIVVAPLVLAWLISTSGWRQTYLIVGITLFVLTVLAAQVLRRDPARMGLLPDGAPVRKVTDITRAEKGYAFREVLGQRAFWMMCLMFFSTFFCTYSLIVHFAPAVVLFGQTEAVGALMVSVLGGASIGGRLLLGFINDKIGSRRSMLLLLTVFVASFVLLQAATSVWLLALFAVLYGFCHGGFYTLVSPLVAEYFGIRSHGAIFGIMIFCGGVGGSLGPFITGAMVDASGSFAGPFLLLLGMAGLGLASIALAGKAGPGPASAEQAVTAG